MASTPVMRKTSWLNQDDRHTLDDFLRSRRWLRRKERIVSVSKAGEGNMNLTLRIVTTHRSVILKQSRPWVEKYPQIAAPVERIEFELQFYQCISELPQVVRRMPEILAADEKAYALLMEDCAAATDFSFVYAGATFPRNALQELAIYLRSLHEGTHANPDSRFSNRQMRSLNHEHMFVVPLDVANGLKLDSFEPGLTAAAREFQRDARYVALVRSTGERYLQDGPYLQHGDFFPGSWLKTAHGIRVIDPEFCFNGYREFDLGCAIAHLALARQTIDSVRLFLDTYARDTQMSSPDDLWLARFAAAEVMRRLIGVAQLPIPRTEGFRASLLRRARQAMLNQSLEPLWAEE